MTAVDSQSESLLEVEHVKQHFPIRKGVLNTVAGHVHAVDDVSFTLREGETLGLVGESGCGKTTLSRTIMRLVDATAGAIRFRGRDVSRASRRELAPLRREMQMVFQDPYASLNPRKRVGQIVGMPLRRHGVAPDEADRRVLELLDRVGLSRDHVNRFPHEFSGGQRQRIGIARALALDPRLIDPTEGSILFRGQDVSHAKRRQLAPLRREMQMVFQDPYASLNPRKRVGQIVGDPLKRQGVASGSDLRRQVQELLERVG
ncbi:MAG TPA: ATP-binding cassette domain-containing protein, partial [Solirubrobacteraceae bacterium]